MDAYKTYRASITYMKVTLVDREKSVLLDGVENPGGTFESGVDVVLNYLLVQEGREYIGREIAPKVGLVGLPTVPTYECMVTTRLVPRP